MKNDSILFISLPQRLKRGVSYIKFLFIAGIFEGQKITVETTSPLKKGLPIQSCLVFNQTWLVTVMDK